LHEGFVLLKPAKFNFSQDNHFWLDTLNGNSTATITLTHHIYVQDTEVSRADFASLMGYDPSITSCDGECPVENVTWYEAVEYANAASEELDLDPCYEMFEDDEDGDGYPDVHWLSDYDCEGFRLPTIGEWLYYAWAGRTMHTHVCCNSTAYDLELFASLALCTIGSFFPDSSAGELEGQFCEGGAPHQLKSKLPNQWGLYDLFGSVPEWLWDRWDTAEVEWCSWCNEFFSLYGFSFVNPGVGPYSGTVMGIEINLGWQYQRTVASYGYWRSGQTVMAMLLGPNSLVEPYFDPYDTGEDWEIDLFRGVPPDYSAHVSEPDDPRPFGFRLVRTARLPAWEVQ